VPEEGVILRRLTVDDPMVIRVYQIVNPQGEYRALKLSLHHRYWNKVTTFTKHLQGELSSMKMLNKPKAKAFMIPLKENSFEYGYLRSFIFSQINKYKDLARGYLAL
jgi:hypothetical protein